ncbi:MAG: hypothetical protein GX946_06690, partial [Oligosphaeraceae bacterium]|nr:hypothetical protein [Oligosphaeraceae bacterium]
PMVYYSTGSRIKGSWPGSGAPPDLQPGKMRTARQDQAGTMTEQRPVSDILC